MRMSYKGVFLSGFFGALLALLILINIGSVKSYAISIKIDSPPGNQQVPVGQLTISGTSSDNSTAQCQVYVDWNSLKPYQLATPTGANGSGDFSKWTYTYDSKYHLIQTGLNDLTSKITCLVPPAGPTVTKWYSINVTGITSSNQSNVQLPLPTANARTPSSSNIQTSTFQSESSINATNATNTLNSDVTNLDLNVEQNPITAGDRQTISVTASDPQTGITLDHVFLRLTIKDPTGNLVKDYTGNDGEISRSFRVGDIKGTYSVLASSSQAGNETTKSTTFVVQ